LSAAGQDEQPWLVNNSMTARGSPALAGGGSIEAVQINAPATAMWR
jgi:hypothetical protein